MGKTVTAEEAEKLIKGLNDRGFWPVPLKTTSNPYAGDGPATGGDTQEFATTHVGDRYDTSPHPAADPQTGITTESFVENMGRLINYLEHSKK